jgi:hypothetical protein
LNLGREEIGLFEVDKELDRCRQLWSSISIGWASVGWSSRVGLTATESIERSAPAKWLLPASTVTVERHDWMESKR